MTSPSPFTAASPPHFTLQEVVGKSINTEQRPWGLESPGRSTLLGSFLSVLLWLDLLSLLSAPGPFPASLLRSVTA